jgi:hypothetical protein
LHPRCAVYPQLKGEILRWQKIRGLLEHQRLNMETRM